MFKKRSIFFLLLLSASLPFLSGCFKNLPAKNVVMNIDFESGRPDSVLVLFYGVPVDSAKIQEFNHSHVFGRFNNNLVRFTLDKLPEHNAVKVEFDLYIHDQWDGDYLRPGSNGVPDVWKMTIDGYPVYVTTFSNGAYNQSFPDSYNGYSNHPAHSNAWELLPGVCSNADKADGSSHYKIEYTTSHTGPLNLELSDALQPFNSPCLKSWSIDNLKITSILYK